MLISRKWKLCSICTYVLHGVNPPLNISTPHSKVLSGIRKYHMCLPSPFSIFSGTKVSSYSLIFHVSLTL